MLKTFSRWWRESSAEEKQYLSFELGFNYRWLSAIANLKRPTNRSTKIAIASVLKQPVNSLFPTEDPIQRETPLRFHGVDQVAMGQASIGQGVEAQ